MVSRSVFQNCTFTVEACRYWSAVHDQRPSSFWVVFYCVLLHVSFRVQVQHLMLQWHFSMKTHGNAWKPYENSFQMCHFRCCCEVPTLSDMPTTLTTLCLSGCSSDLCLWSVVFLIAYLVHTGAVCNLASPGFMWIISIVVLLDTV